MTESKNKNQELFRVWDKKAEDFVFHPTANADDYPSERYIIDWNTGITDANEKPIYQRDVVRTGNLLTDVASVIAGDKPAKLKFSPQGEPFTVVDFVYGKLVFSDVTATMGIVSFEQATVGKKLAVVGLDH